VFRNGEAIHDNEKVLYGGYVGRPSVDPAREGHTFVGWYTDRSFLDLFDFGEAVTEGKIVYAKFEANTDKVWSSDSPPTPGNAVNPVNIAEATVAPIPDVTFTENGVKPSVSIKFGKVQLKSEEDYTLSYDKNRAIGTGIVVISGIGKYKGAKKINFNIVPKRISFSSLKGNRTSVTLKWKKASSIQKVTGYRIAYRAKSGAWKTKVFRSSFTKTVIKKLAKGKTYEFKIRAYKTINGVEYCSQWSKIRSIRIK
jgi:uncharacterized repeat protein (TIGR02543 family)